VFYSLLHCKTGYSLKIAANSLKKLYFVQIAADGELTEKDVSDFLKISPLVTRKLDRYGRPKLGKYRRQLYTKEPYPKTSPVTWLDKTAEKYD